VLGSRAKLGYFFRTHSCCSEPPASSCVRSNMNSRFHFDDDALIEGSHDQRELLRLVRTARAELSQHLADLGCMNPGEIGEYLTALDQLIDLHVWASTHDDRIASLRDKMYRNWGNE
jgi:hypothetical protein